MPTCVSSDVAEFVPKSAIPQVSRCRGAGGVPSVLRRADGRSESAGEAPKIEALHAGTTSDGEREAARRAADRIKERLAEARSAEPDEEHVLSVIDPWQRMLFVALCRRYGLRPFRRPRQRHSTVQVVAPKTFVDGTLWPEFVALAGELHKHLSEVTDRIVREAIHGDVSEAEESTAPMALTAGAADRK